jgi:NADH:ubiquinone oxidoreductase subunit F (NADH-binding)
LDGARAVAGVVGARRVLVAITDPDLAEPVRRALASRPDAGLFELHGLFADRDRFVVGEAGALIAALNGAAGVPPGRRVLPTERGVAGRPTLLSNAETFAQLGVLVRLGAARYGSIGAPGEPGSTLLTVSGAVATPGVLEVPLGSSLASAAAAVGAGPSQAVLVGGYHGSWLVPDPNLPLSRAGLAAAGGTLGAGVLAFVGSDTCALAELARVTQWLADQSAKQCGPCSFGLPALAADLRGLLTGQVGPALARHVGQLAGRGACAHPDGAVRFVRSGLAALAGEVGLHRACGSCRRSDRGQLATVRPAVLRGLS